jgi:hypothetical protein
MTITIRLALLILLTLAAAPALASTEYRIFPEPRVCVVIHQVGVVRGADPETARQGFDFPCAIDDDAALYRYRHGMLKGQESWWWHGFNPSTGTVD